MNGELNALEAVAPEQAVVGRERPRLLLCPPDYFDSHFLFNPFVNYRGRVDRRRARTQWRRLVTVLQQAGAELDFLEPDPASSQLTFTADGAFCYMAGRALLLKNDGPRGLVEPDLFARWLTAHGITTEAAPPRYRLDGGNLLRLASGDVLAGLKPGSTLLGERYLGRLLRLTSGRKVVGVPLAGHRYLHLDTVVGVLAADTFLVYPGGLAGGVLPREGPFAEAEIVVVDEADAARFGCNTVVVGDVVVTGPVSARLVRAIRRLGFEVERIDLGEFYKAGGGAKCLTLPLWLDR
jgi:N-dimethylarginine dimethylaminohydrolase